MTNLPAEIIITSDKPEFSVIWLHGLGADGHDFVSIIPELKLPPSLGIKFIFPHAPVRPVTLNGGTQMRAWYDLLSLDGNKTANEDDILSTVEWINQLIETEIESGVSPDKILLAGFSQGGVIALHTGLRYPKKLAGIMLLSTYIPFDANLLQHKSQSGLAVFAAHGQYDPVIPFASWQAYVPKLEASGYKVEAHAYPMEHSLCLEEINDISKWLQNTLR
jgi:phospholipase/carboxylesterase